jgi:acyl-CoA reductase-like NAD-dependent aldehyde dehydrogenase
MEMLIGGRWQSAASGRTEDVTSPFDGTVTGTVQLDGDALPLDANRGTGLDKIGFTIHQPVGIVVAITPFNYPALLVLHSLGDGLITDPRVPKVSFTGSTATGEHITRIAGIKKLSLELGSSCPVVVLPDADIELAASAVASGGYVNAGQVCISVQRVITHPAVGPDFLDALVPKVEAIRTGERDGTIVSPAVVAGVDPRSPFSQEELFGPAVAVSSAEDREGAIAQANGTPYGLGAGMPYGGLKASGVGKEGPRSAVAEMTDIKTVILHGRPW